MSLSDELLSEVSTIFATSWQSRVGQQVPEPESVKLGNDAVELDATVLYADLAESTELVNANTWSLAAEVYKAYLVSASRIIKSEGGTITAFDGDRVMGVFMGDAKNTSAVRCALKINYAVQKIINPAIANQYKPPGYQVRHGIGVDSSVLRAVRTGIRGSNDLVWIGRSANIAAKLCSLREERMVAWITSDVYERLRDETKYTDGASMWESRYWSAQNMSVFASSWTWKP